MANIGLVDFGLLPEECLALAISLTTPRDACRAAATSASFRVAADSDAVWARFLPSDLDSILGTAGIAQETPASKKELFFRLCDRPVLVDGGRMSFGLDRESGAKRFMLSARSLVIVWSDTPRYWKWIQISDSRFSEACKLLNVCWLEIRGKLQCRMLSPKLTYEVYLVFKVAEESYGLVPVKASIFVGSFESKTIVNLMPPDENDADQGQRENEDNVQYPRPRGDGWMESKLGEFYNDGDDEEVMISIMETDDGKWKRGLIVQGIEFKSK